MQGVAPTKRRRQSSQRGGWGEWGQGGREAERGREREWARAPETGLYQEGWVFFVVVDTITVLDASTLVLFLAWGSETDYGDRKQCL